MTWEINSHETVYIKDDVDLFNSKDSPVNLVAILRVRNEGLILVDTLNHLSQFADVICAYDDASTDDSNELLRSHPRVKLIIQSEIWQEGVAERLFAETRHRGLLLEYARRIFNFKWVLCADADERFIGNIKDYVSESIIDKPKGIRINLFDAYMTNGDDRPITRGEKLLNFRKYFGPECREILMLWQNNSDAEFVGLDAREPKISDSIQSNFYCQHYGKSLSYEHWDETCNYYIRHFPWETYGSKWFARKQKALHIESDFGRKLYKWGPDLFLNRVAI